MKNQGHKIVTTYVNPPVPTRNLDWQAHLDGQEEDGPVGHGLTELSAIEDLLENLED